MIKRIGLPLRGRPILLINRMITDQIGLHSVLLPLLIVLVIITITVFKAEGLVEWFMDEILGQMEIFLYSLTF